jgi:hypothetical protein
MGSTVAKRILWGLGLLAGTVAWGDSEASHGDDGPLIVGQPVAIPSGLIHESSRSTSPTIFSIAGREYRTIASSGTVSTASRARPGTDLDELKRLVPRRPYGELELAGTAQARDGLSRSQAIFRYASQWTARDDRGSDAFWAREKLEHREAFYDRYARLLSGDSGTAFIDEKGRLRAGDPQTPRLTVQMRADGFSPVPWEIVKKAGFDPKDGRIPFLVPNGQGFRLVDARGRPATDTDPGPLVPETVLALLGKLAEPPGSARNERDAPIPIEPAPVFPPDFGSFAGPVDPPPSGDWSPSGPPSSVPPASPPAAPSGGC